MFRIRQNLFLALGALYLGRFGYEGRLVLVDSYKLDQSPKDLNSTVPFFQNVPLVYAPPHRSNPRALLTSLFGTLKSDAVPPQS